MKPLGKKRSLFHSFRDAFRGVWACLKSERNMRIHAVACGYVLFFAFEIKVDRGGLASLLLAMGLVTAAETMNTSVEKLCDRFHSGYDREIGRVKDLAAGAVVLAALFAALTGGAVLLRPELWQAVLDIVGTGWKLGLFAASVAASVVIVFVVPLKKD